jgi:hypothetical protein
MSTTIKAGLLPGILVVARTFVMGFTGIVVSTILTLFFKK